MNESYIEVYYWIDRGGEDFDSGVEVFTGKNMQEQSEKFCIELKKRKDAFDCIENDVKSLWRRDGYISSHKKKSHESFRSNVYENKSPFTLKVWII